MELMKSADDTVRNSITAFCHVCHLYTRAISALKFGGAWVTEAGWSGPGDVRALRFRFFGAVFASKGYPYRSVFEAFEV